MFVGWSVGVALREKPPTVAELSPCIRVMIGGAPAA